MPNRIEIPSAATAQFVRQARRIRHIGRSDIDKTHAALRNLIAAKGGRAARPVTRGDWSRSAVLGVRSDAARSFADYVAARLVGGALPWSARKLLLRQAAMMGIGRFEANLMIAAVQHEVAGRPSPGARGGMAYRKLKLPLALVTFLAVQSVIVAAVWRLVF